MDLERVPAADAERVERDGVAALAAAADADALEDGAHRRSSATGTGESKRCRKRSRRSPRPTSRPPASASTRRARDSTSLHAERKRRSIAARDGARRDDLTLPARRQWRGAKHPVTLVIEEIEAIFRELGFTVALGPEAETEWYNFGALNFPPNHPALDAARHALPRGTAALLRTHTSPVQIRTLQRIAPPIRVLDSRHRLSPRLLRRVARAGVRADRRAVRRRGDQLRRPQGDAERTSPSASSARRARVSVRSYLPVHGAVGRDGRAVRRLRRRRLPGVQGHRLDRDPRLGHGASERCSRRRASTASGTPAGRSAWARRASRSADTAFRTSDSSTIPTCASWSRSPNERLVRVAARRSFRSTQSPRELRELITAHIATVDELVALRAGSRGDRRRARRRGSAASGLRSPARHEGRHGHRHAARRRVRRAERHARASSIRSRRPAP